MKKAIILMVTGLLLLVGSFVALAADNPFDETGTVAAADAYYCKRNIMVDGRFRGSCYKYTSTIYNHRVRVVCNNGMYDVAHDGPVKLTLWYPSDNWSYSFGCSPGEQFKYYTVLVWRA